ncbi:hypothetical protein AK812_SmicGene4549 [Symbiodinium microadriaticum]|uniref:Uncharacterized protein n=1 Tax=Symbiodinium microadriaticum TaxID=2951 RepID=A0A1Q9EW06_SYMMI|nr:hypothetical protein AK812_SmicGene4549 [Symbiodinium microadriaticum]
MVTYRSIEVNLDAAGDVVSGWYQHSMFLPHEVMGCIYDFDRELFHKFFGNPEAVCTRRDPRILPAHENVRFALVVQSPSCSALLCSGNDEFIRIHGWYILPDVMHILHLACFGDVLTSILLDFSDNPFPWPGSSRDSRLEHGWHSYKGYCQRWGIQDRAERKLFTNEALKADYATVSQKIMRAAAAKYMIFWLHWLVESLLQGDPEQPEDLKCRLIFGVVTGLMIFEQTQLENGASNVHWGVGLIWLRRL